MNATINQLLPVDYVELKNYGALKNLIKQFKPEALYIRFGVRRPYIRFNVQINLLKPYVRDALIRDYNLKPTNDGLTLFVTLW